MRNFKPPYGLNPGQYAALKKRANINPHSIVMQANNPTALRLCLTLMQALKTDKAVLLTAPRPSRGQAVLTSMNIKPKT